MTASGPDQPICSRARPSAIGGKAELLQTILIRQAVWDVLERHGVAIVPGGQDVRSALGQIEKK